MLRFVQVSLLCLCWPIAVSGQAVPRELTLADALRLAAERNPTLAAARNLVDAAEADRVTARQRPNPALTFDSEGASPFRTQSAGDGHEYVVRADQEIEIGGRRGLRIRLADQGVEAFKATYRDQARRLEMEVRRAYFQVVLARADQAVSATALTEIDRVIELNRARLTVGEISGAELRRVQVERLRFQDDVFAAELAVRNARASLLALLNMADLRQTFEPVDALAPPAADVTTILASITRISGTADSVASLPRGDIQAARLGERQAETSTRLQRALRSPMPTVGGGYKHNGGNGTLVFGVTVPLPLFSRNQGPIARAEAERRAAEQRATAVERQAALEIQQAVNAVEINRERVSYIEREYLGNAREARDVVLASYRLGAADLIDLLDAQRAFRDTSRTYNRALYEQRLSLIELAAAIGASPEGR